LRQKKRILPRGIGVSVASGFPSLDQSQPSSSMMRRPYFKRRRQGTGNGEDRKRRTVDGKRKRVARTPPSRLRGSSLCVGRVVHRAPAGFALRHKSAIASEARAGRDGLCGFAFVPHARELFGIADVLERVGVKHEERSEEHTSELQSR